MNIKLQIFILIVVVISLFLIGMVFFGKAGATYQEKVNICHRTESENNPWNAIRINQSALETHLEHGDFLYEGPVKENGHPTNDGDEWCEENEPEEEITPTEGVTPTIIECDQDECVTPTLTPDPTATPTATVTPGEGEKPEVITSDGRSDGKSSCPDCTKAPAQPTLIPIVNGSGK